MYPIWRIGLKVSPKVPLLMVYSGQSIYQQKNKKLFGKPCISSSLLLKVSYNTGSSPKEWKLANIVSIHKKRSKDDIKNCKPISLTCLVTELFERILKEELLLRTSHLIDSRQLGFLDLKSCPTNIISFTDKVVLSINNVHKLSTDVVYFDFSKAFDSVNHDLILDK